MDQVIDVMMSFFKLAIDLFAIETVFDMLWREHKKAKRERRGLTVREQDAPSVSLDELAEVYGGDQMEANEVEVALER